MVAIEAQQCFGMLEGSTGCRTYERGSRGPLRHVQKFQPNGEESRVYRHCWHPPRNIRQASSLSSYSDHSHRETPRDTFIPYVCPLSVMITNLTLLAVLDSELLSWPSIVEIKRKCQKGDRGRYMCRFNETALRRVTLL